MTNKLFCFVIFIKTATSVLEVNGKESCMSSTDEICVSSTPASDSGGDSVPSLESRLAHARRILSEVPLIDGHNDLPYSINNLLRNRLEWLPANGSFTHLEPFASEAPMTDIPKLRAGQVGGQFWSAYIDCSSQYKNSVSLILEQIDVIRRLIDLYSSDLEFVTTAEGIVSAHGRGKIASLIGIEGGHAIDSNLAVLRSLYRQGARYLTLTHTCNTPWANSSTSEVSGDTGGLSSWGEIVIKEMNRLGIFVDLSHVSSGTMLDVLRVARAPVIFSHSSARSLCNHTRNVPDDVLRLVAPNGGVVMVTFVAGFLSCSKTANLSHVIDHINHVREVAGVNHIGLGGDYNGTPVLPEGLEDTSKYPFLFAELLKDSKWTEEDLKKLAGLNLLRAFREMERVRDELSTEAPWETPIPEEDIADHLSCRV